MPDHETFHGDPRPKGHREGQRQGNHQRNRVIGHEKLHDIAGVCPHHDEFSVGHVDDAHLAKGNRQADRGQEID